MFIILNINCTKEGDYFIIKFDVIFDWTFPSERIASYQLDENRLIGSEEDLIQLDKDISKHCLKKELITAPLNKRVHRNGIIIIRRT